jgi:small GTP-binding protein
LETVSKDKKQPLVLGILAHVDAGKTTLSEAMLYISGTIRQLGRVDYQDAFLDTDVLERERGITIFSKQAVFSLGEKEITLLDTPGHVDFSSEMERTLQVLDYAVLVVSGTDGVQSHTRTVWRLLQRYGIPVFVFVNKMDLPGCENQSVLKELRKNLSDRCVDFSGRRTEAFWENIAENDEDALDEYLNSGLVSEKTMARMIQERNLFPCYFGSALKLLGVNEFLEGLDKLTKAREYTDKFGAKVYKISRDRQGDRLTYLKVTGGCLKVRDLISSPQTRKEDGEEFPEEKVDQIRIYSGTKYQTVPEVPAGKVCAVTGLSHTRPGDVLGFEENSACPVLEPVLSCRVFLPEGADPHRALGQLRELEEEDPQLHIIWNEQLREIHLQMMGEVQLEILKRVIAERFGMDVSFGAAGIVYRETIQNAVEGVGHFEPLRHYAEVHLLLGPAPRGSGIQYDTACSEDVLSKNWQRLILTHLKEKTHLGVLTGSPVTDLKMTLIAGRAHIKHTEGGDFRQATYRAVRQGLRKAKSVLLEPYYSFQLEVPSENVGRAMSDLQRLSAKFDPPQMQEDFAVLTGIGPVSKLRDYQLEVSAYTHGKGHFWCSFKGYEPCHDAQRVIEESGYDSDRDTLNPADSVFCSHGAGFVVKWNEVEHYMHINSGLQLNEPESE